ncbi:periplasmic esterase [Escherichia coli]|uniref:Periplasmic esterase n=1 Tax=Escherichia coli TaxID=562 RepID=A0A377C7N9_ECOLX|nr:periplasmic esterase [Escherichia coli]
MAQPIKATTGTLYDLASNTKMYATNFALQKLMSEGKLHPDDSDCEIYSGICR